MQNIDFPSLNAFTKAAETAIARNNDNRALGMIYDAVEWIITEPLCAGEVYGSPVFDALCQQIGNRSFAKLTATPSPAPSDKPLYIYIGSRLQRSGGHTRLLRDFILTRPDAHHLILITGLVGKSDLNWLNALFKDIPNYQCLQAPRGTLEAKLHWLQTELITRAPTHTYLFNHHQDSVAAAAIVPAMKLDATFCHHGDHHLCLGVYLKHMTHLDYHPMGYHNCRDNLGIDNRYIPLTVPDRLMREPAPFLQNGTLTTCTAAGSNKLEIPYVVQYVDVIPALLAATGGTHHHFGKLTRKARNAIARGLAARNVPADRFVYTPWVSSVWSALQSNRVDVYISSFPYGGGLTMMEAMGAGIPVITHRHIFLRTLSGFDLNYPGSFSWSKVDELIAQCAALTPSILAMESLVARNHYERYHSRDLLANLLKLDAAPLTVPTLDTNYHPERDAWAWWAAQQVGLRQLLWRKAYRLYRFIRAQLAH